MAVATRVKLPGLAACDTRFDPEFELLVACCKPGKRSDLGPLLAPELDWDHVLESAEHHRLIPPLYAALRLEVRAPSSLRVRAHKHAWRALRFTTELKKIGTHFEQHGIQFLAHKGPVLSQVLYDDPAMRQFGDLDLLVRPRDVSPARAALMELGYEPGLQLSPGQENFFLRAGYEYTFGANSQPNLVELQWQIVPRFCSINFDIDNIFSRSVQSDLDGLALRTMGHDDLMLALCVHAAKHGWAQLGMLRDIATLAEFELDWNWITTEARRLGILRILQVSLLAVRALFDVDLPVLMSLPGRGTQTIASALTLRLKQNYEPDTKSIVYFHSQLKIRERRRDRARLIWRLTTTPTVQEWQAVRIPDRYFALYRGVRIGRLLKRLLTWKLN